MVIDDSNVEEIPKRLLFSEKFQKNEIGYKKRLELSI